MNRLKAFWKRLRTPPNATSTPSASNTASQPAGESVPFDRSAPPSNWTKRFTPPPAVEIPYFTPRAQEALVLAREEADRFHHNFVGTEHLLLGLLAHGRGVAANVLQKMGIDLQNARAEVEKQIGIGPDQKTVGNIPYTPRVKKVLALAAKEAKSMYHTYVGTEHILLGLLREGDGVAGRVLKILGVDVEKTRDEILLELDPIYRPPAVATGTSPTAPPQKTMTPKSLPEPIDITLRYDVYCREQNDRVVVYRNALFKNLRGLMQRRDHDMFGEFMELEQRDGQTVFIAKTSIIRFCQHGVKADPEVLSGGPAT